MTLKSEIESRIKRDNAIGFLLLAAYFYVGWNYINFQTSNLNAVLDRLVYTAQWQILDVGLLIVMILTVGMTRGSDLTKVGDPTKPMPASHVINVHCRVLQNTVEQFVIRAPSELILSTYLDAGCMKIIPLLVILFVVGRVVYWIGYVKDPFKRVLGFTLTQMPTIFIVFYCVYSLIAM